MLVCLDVSEDRTASIFWRKNVLKKLWPITGRENCHENPRNLSEHFKYINQPDATISQVYYLTFTRMYSSTCFGRPHAYHQEPNNCSRSLWLHRWSVVVAVLLVVVGPVGLTTTNSTATTTLQRYKQRLLLQLLGS